MCIEVLIGAINELPIVEWDEANPGFYLSKVSGNNLPKAANASMKSIHYYEAGSFMGCSCGFSYGDWSKNDNHHLRVTDVKKLMRYLADNFNGNNLKLFCPSWENFPDEYEEKAFNINTIDENEFYFEEDVILKIEI